MSYNSTIRTNATKIIKTQPQLGQRCQTFRSAGSYSQSPSFIDALGYAITGSTIYAYTGIFHSIKTDTANITSITGNTAYFSNIDYSPASPTVGTHLQQMLKPPLMM